MVMTNTLFATGVRQRSLMHLKVSDIDFDNRVLYVHVKKNRKTLIVPQNITMANILKEFLQFSQHKDNDSLLFCSVFGSKSTHLRFSYPILEF